MSFLIDTCALSEVTRPTPDKRVLDWFGERILAIDAKVADEWGRLMARSARTAPVLDSLLAATALHHRLSVVTRNVADFAPSGVPLVNPWDAD